MKATLLVQLENPPDPDAAVSALDAAASWHGATEWECVRTVGAYDLVATVTAPNADLVARIVLAAQQSPAVARTLSLPHVLPEEV